MKNLILISTENLAAEDDLIVISDHVKSGVRLGDLQSSNASTNLFSDVTSNYAKPESKIVKQKAPIIESKGRTSVMKNSDAVTDKIYKESSSRLGMWRD